MDSKGLVNLEYLFSIIIIITLLISFMPLVENSLDVNKNIEENSNARILLDDVSDSINQVNSNSYGFIKKIDLPEKLNNKSYLIIVKSDEIQLEFDSKKGKSNINPIKMINRENQSLEEIKLYNGNSYLLKKLLIEDNKTKLYNQSSILIQEIPKN